MELQEKFDIAVKMLEQGVSMGDICFCTSQKLAQIAEQRLDIDPSNLELFAEEVGHRSARLQEENSATMILVTDDNSAFTRLMESFGIDYWPVENVATWLELGYREVFRIRSEAFAAKMSEILGREITATDEPLPSLHEGEFVMHLKLFEYGKELKERLFFNVCRYAR